MVSKRIISKCLVVFIRREDAPDFLNLSQQLLTYSKSGIEALEKCAKYV